MSPCKLTMKQSGWRWGSNFVEKTKGAFKRYGWNRYRIHCVGPHIRIFVNGVPTTDYVDTMHREGYIAVQHHGEKGKIYRFRNIRISAAD